MKDKYNYLLKNTSILLLSNFSSKILVFLLVPLYTSVLSTEEYGTYDIMFTTIQLLYPILSLNIIDAVMRFPINANKNKQKEIFSVGLKYIFISILCFAVGCILINTIFKVEILDKFYGQFILLYISYVFYNFITQFAKGIEAIRYLAFSGIISTILTLTLNIYFLLYMHLGIIGYFYANIISMSIASLYLLLRIHFIQFIKFQICKNKLEHEMLVYSIPLIFTTLSWYINSVSDRYIVTFFCGIATNGIYSVSYKIPSILNAVQSVFLQSWQLSAIKDFNRADKDGFFKDIYENCNKILILICSILMILIKVLAKLLFANNFFIAWKFVPFLLISIVFNTLSGTLGGIFAAVKDSKSMSQTAIFGAVINIILNIGLIKLFGAQGAAIATCISSFVIWITRLKLSRKHIVLKINLKKNFIDFSFLSLQAIVIITINSNLQYGLQIIIFIIICIMNFDFINFCRFLKLKNKIE